MSPLIVSLQIEHPWAGNFRGTILRVPNDAKSIADAQKRIGIVSKRVEDLPWIFSRLAPIAVPDYFFDSKNFALVAALAALLAHRLVLPPVSVRLRSPFVFRATASVIPALFHH